MRIVHDREYDSNQKSFSQQSGEEVQYQINFDRLMADRGSSVSTVVWSSDTATITNESITNNLATATISSERKHNLIKVVANQANGVDRVKYLRIQVIDPQVTSDY